MVDSLFEEYDLVEVALLLDEVADDLLFGRATVEEALARLELITERRKSSNEDPV